MHRDHQVYCKISELIFGLKLLVALGYSVVEKVDANRYDTDTILADANLTIGDLMPSVADTNIIIEPLDL
jgi:hypothetical protein